MFAPLNQLLISTIGWMGAMWTMAVAALATIPLARLLLARAPADGAARGGSRRRRASALSMREQLAIAARDKSYWCLHAGFFTCGFHIAFLVTHLPGEVKLCSLPAAVAASSLSIIGLANVAGSLWAGWAGGVVRMKYLLFAMYFSRAVAVAIYLAAPKTALTFYLFAAVLGFTWLATVPPTAGLIGKLFGVRYLATLFGLATFTHQIGGFFGAWLGGIALVRFGDYSWMWYADIALALAGGVREPADPRGTSCDQAARNGPVPVLIGLDPSAADQAVRAARTAALSGNTLLSSAAAGHAEVIAQHALHDRAQVARRLEVAALVEIGARQPRPVGDHAPAGHGAA